MKSAVLRRPAGLPRALAICVDFFHTRPGEREVEVETAGRPQGGGARAELNTVLM